MARNTQRPPDVAQLVRWECCDRQLKQTLQHYDHVACPKCGAVWWVLQPQRVGPFECRRWPGNWRTQQAREARELQREAESPIS